MHCDARPTVTFPAEGHHRRLTGTIHCVVTDARVCEQLAQGRCLRGIQLVICWVTRRQTRFHLWPWLSCCLVCSGTERVRAGSGGRPAERARRGGAVQLRGVETRPQGGVVQGRQADHEVGEVRHPVEERPALAQRRRLSAGRRRQLHHQTGRHLVHCQARHQRYWYITVDIVSTFIHQSFHGIISDSRVYSFRL